MFSCGKLCSASGHLAISCTDHFQLLCSAGAAGLCPHPSLQKGPQRTELRANSQSPARCARAGRTARVHVTPNPCSHNHVPSWVPGCLVGSGSHKTTPLCRGQRQGRTKPFMCVHGCAEAHGVMNTEKFPHTTSVCYK